jgi:mono/diheme cytochrome c family protein
MSFRNNLIPVTLLLSLSAVVVAGCSDAAKESSFVYSDKTATLISEARRTGIGEQPGVEQLLDERFGNPQHLHAWLKLPIDFGGTTATVTSSAQDGSAVKSISVQINGGEGVDIAEGAVIQFLSGDCKDETAEVFAWDPDTGELMLQEATKNTPSEGDQIVIEGGNLLRHGRALYMRHCSHCHGTSGDGNGPTAAYLNPRPRDYRNGVFKFTSTTELNKTSRDDLTRVLKYGIPGTYMPSFLLLEDDEIHNLVEYVRFLAMRGEFERSLATELTVDYSIEAVADRLEGSDETLKEIEAELQEFLSIDFQDALSYVSDDLAEKWTVANTEEALVTPDMPRVPDSPESRRRGRELFLGKTLNCADCHGAYGRGNGPQTMAFEKNPVTGEVYGEAGLHDIWDNLNQPRDLNLGIYRGGRRPIDIFCRIHAGTKGSRMPSFKNVPHEDIWNVVNYVLSVPFEPDPGATGTPAAPAAADVPGGK